MALGLAAIAVDGVIEAFRRGELEVYGLARERPKAGGDEEQPGKQLRPVFRRAEEFAGFLSEVDEDRRGIEDARRLSAGTFGVHDRRNLAVGVDRAKGGRVLLAFARVDRDDLVGKPASSRKRAIFAGFGVGMVVEADHSGILFRGRGRRAAQNAGHVALTAAGVQAREQTLRQRTDALSLGLMRLGLDVGDQTRDIFRNETPDRAG